MSHVVIDLGTSRTAVAIQTGAWSHLDGGARGGGALATYAVGIGQMMEGVAALSVRGHRFRWACTNSRFVRVGDIVIPLVLPAGQGLHNLEGVTSVPTLEWVGDDARLLQTVKDRDKTEWARALLDVVISMVAPFTPAGSQWVIGRSYNAVDPRQLPLPSTVARGLKTYYEAHATLCAVLNRALTVRGTSKDDAEGAIEDGDPLVAIETSGYQFVVVADLGGGFLDICLAEGVRPGNDSAHRVVSFGSYPIGVDRVGGAFGERKLENPDKLAYIIAAALSHHLADYATRVGGKTRGVVYELGGGFQRIGPTQSVEALVTSDYLRQMGGSLELRWERPDPVRNDTKELTLWGLQRLAASDAPELDEDANLASAEAKGTNALLKRLAERLGGLQYQDTWYETLAGALLEAYPVPQ